MYEPVASTTAKVSTITGAYVWYGLYWESKAFQINQPSLGRGWSDNPMPGRCCCCCCCCCCRWYFCRCWCLQGLPIGSVTTTTTTTT